MLQLGQIDRADDRPPYRQIASMLRTAIESNVLAAGDRLPSEAELIEHFGVARMTARQAVQQLRGEGLVVSEHGRGVFVRREHWSAGDLVGRSTTTTTEPPTRRKTPRRTVRFADEVWEAGQAKAEAQGETLTEVLRRLLDSYLVDNHQGLHGYSYEYRAVPKDLTLTDAERQELTVDGIAGRYDDVRRLYPAKHWHLDERTVSPYKSATHKSA
jgi:DNA-binding GntR family transcriptional regulator